MKKEIICLLIILVIASFFRLWRLNSIPPGLYPDVAINGNEALNSLKNGNFKVFYPENNGREGLMMWLIALSFSIFGVSVWSIKIVAAIVGILTVLGLYLLTKELFNKNIALLSSFFLAISFWHVNFSRIGFRAILLPFILVFAFYFLFRGFHKKRILYFIISGLFLGLGFYTYTSYRLIVLLLPLVLFFWWLIYKKQNLQKQFLLFTFYFLLFTFIITLPIGIYFLKNPQDFISRAAPISIFKAENPVKEFFKSLFLHLGMFNFHGDPNWRHNFAGSPELFWPVGILFLIGFFISVREIFRKSNYQNQNYQLLSAFYFLVSNFFIMLLPGILTKEGSPHSLRVIGTLPTVFIFSAIGTEMVYLFLIKKFKKEKIINFAFLLFFLICLFFEFEKYFFVWAKKPQVKGEFTEELLEMGNYLNSLPKDFEKYVIVNRGGVPISWAKNLPIPCQTIMFLENSKYGEIQSHYLLPENLNEIKIKEKGIILLLNFDENLFKKIEERFPQGKIKKINEFFVYEVR